MPGRKAFLVLGTSPSSHQLFTPAPHVRRFLSLVIIAMDSSLCGRVLAAWARHVRWLGALNARGRQVAALHAERVHRVCWRRWEQRLSGRAVLRRAMRTASRFHEYAASIGRDGVDALLLEKVLA